jgi:hypothetical protein
MVVTIPGPIICSFNAYRHKRHAAAGGAGVVRPSTYRFYLKNGSANTTVNWGLDTDLPVTGKWS